MNRFLEKHQGEKLSFQQYGVALFTQLRMHGASFSETISKVETYVEKVNHILAYVGSNTFVRSVQQEIEANIIRITAFTAFIKAYLENRDNFLSLVPNGKMEYLTHILVRLIAHGNLTHAQSLLIYKLCRFHSEFCDILNQIEGKNLIPQKSLDQLLK